MSNVFIPTATAGLALESALRSVGSEQNKRQRQVRFRGAITALQVLGLVDRKAKPIGLAEGCNYLGEKGFWIVLEAQREVAEGPQIHKYETDPHWIMTDMDSDLCYRCGQPKESAIHEVPHGQAR